MPYKIEIPTQVKEQIIDIWNSPNLKTKNKIEYLVTVYCRYVEKLESTKTLEQKIKSWVNCSDCVPRVYNYFEAKVNEWTGESWPELDAINKEYDEQNEYRG